MVKVIWSVAGLMVIAAIGLFGYDAYRARSCVGLENKYLNAVSAMERAAVTQPIAKMYGSDGQAHELAIKVNTDAMVYYLGRISKECGTEERENASRKANEIVGL